MVLINLSIISYSHMNKILYSFFPIITNLFIFFEILNKFLAESNPARIYLHIRKSKAKSSQKIKSKFFFYVKLSSFLTKCHESFNQSQNGWNMIRFIVQGERVGFTWNYLFKFTHYITRCFDPGKNHITQKLVFSSYFTNVLL